MRVTALQTILNHVSVIVARTQMELTYNTTMNTTMKASLQLVCFHITASLLSLSLSFSTEIIRYHAIFWTSLFVFSLVIDHLKSFLVMNQMLKAFGERVFADFSEFQAYYLLHSETRKSTPTVLFRKFGLLIVETNSEIEQSDGIILLFRNSFSKTCTAF